MNLIGEHTDYNDGFVLPCAIAYDTRVRAVARDDRILTARSAFAGEARFDLERLPAQPAGGWTDYLVGILSELRHAGVALRGADLNVTGTVPIGAGLSASASFEIAIALALLGIADSGMPSPDLARLAQRAEIAYAGTRCGIMDQFTVLLGREGYALFLDTRSLEYDLIPVPRGAAVVICNSMVKHELAASAYNERRSECERAANLLRSRYPAVRALRDVSSKQLAEAESLLPPLLFARARHVVTENERVREAAQALRSGDLARFGALMYASHESLRVDYAVSCWELDLLVEIAKTFDGTIGARMTGGGFGGCTVNLVRADRARAFREHVAAAYSREAGIAPDLFDGTPSAGASVIGE